MNKEKTLQEALKKGLLVVEELKNEEVEKLVKELDKMGYVLEKVYSTGNYLIYEDEFLD